MSRTIIPAVLALLLLAPAAPAQETEPAPRTISVSGEAVSTAANDTAAFRFGVVAARSTPNAALLAVSRSMRRVLEAVQAQGVEARDIQTRDVSVRRVLSRPRRGGPRLVSYRARNSISVIVRDVSRSGAVVDAAVGAGATDVDGPRLSFSGTPRLYREALAAAFRDAREKAEALAAEAGMRLGRPLSIGEGFQENVSGGFAAPTQRESTPAPPIRRGETEVEATVSVVFEVE